MILKNEVHVSFFSRRLLVWSTVYLLVLIWSMVNPKDQFTWFLEVTPALIGGMVLIFTRFSFPLTSLTYSLILIHCVILMIGGHYTYAEVPLFDWIRDALQQERNNYDKVGHFVQGFVPAIIAREIVIRKSIISLPGWRSFFIICFCLAFSAFYELIEWLVALLTGEDAEAFLGTQGFVWDTQTDMALALLGALLALMFLSKVHDRQLLTLGKK